MNLRRNRCIELILVILGLTVNYVSCSSNSYPREKRAEKKVDPGEPLFLTPYLTDANNKNEPEKARILEKARNLSKVTFPELPDIVSYAGYFSVNFTKPFWTANSFFWYFPAQVDSKNAPVVLFIEGRWDDTAIAASLVENGPFMIDGVGRLKMREESWNKKLNLIYIDTFYTGGYAFSEDMTPYPTDKNAQHMHVDALRHFFELFPLLRENDFFVVGKRWGAQHVIKLCQAIHQYNTKAAWDRIIHLKGMAVGNAWLHPVSRSNIDEYLYESGLIDARGKEMFLAKEKELSPNKTELSDSEAYGVFVKLFFNQPPAFLNTLTGYEAPINILEDRSSLDVDNFRKWIRNNFTRRALHVGSTEFTEYPTIPDYFGWGKTRFGQSDIISFLEKFRVLIYTGNLDVFCSYPNVENWINESTAPSISIAEIKRAERQKWEVDGELAGYIRTGGNLTEVVIRNAGRYPAIDQPKYNRQLIELFAHGLL